MSFAQTLALGLMLVTGLVPRAAGAQSTAPERAPTGWRWVLDAPGVHAGGSRDARADSVFDFVNMAPGWHITMGPGGALFDSRERAEGRFVVEGELILFPDGSDAEYGVFVGGRALDGAHPEWLAFVVRGDGSAGVLHRAGAETRALMPWTTHAAVKPRVGGATSKNVVTVRAEPDSVRFLVNGERVGAFARSAVPVDGAFGFRIGRGVNLHITNLDVSRRLAPFPAPRR